AVKGLTYSPIKGPEGNIEYLLWLEKQEEIPEEVLALSETEAIAALSELLAEGNGVSHKEEMAVRIKEVIEEAHRALDEAK
ncbi:MAG: TlyA family RNA methyltransferase, partial [Lachnospiraceae bacterium]|nr:TlyA family RNA methyltransferase [Lachnospiraceae bacterium]